MIKKYTDNQIDELATILNSDGIISVPTDTVYGICTKMNSKKAYEKLIKYKKRDKNKALPVMCANKKQIKSLAYINKKSEKIINTFMPGPITIILKKKENLDEYITNGKDTIAIRMATSKAIKKIIEKIDSPIFMTSANESGKKTCTSIKEIEEACPYLDGILKGNVEYKKESTIIDCTTDEIKIIREGPINLKDIKKIIN